LFVVLLAMPLAESLYKPMPLLAQGQPWVANRMIFPCFLLEVMFALLRERYQGIQNRNSWGWRRKAMARHAFVQADFLLYHETSR
jgi:hypothetical protein